MRYRGTSEYGGWNGWITKGEEFSWRSTTWTCLHLQKRRVSVQSNALEGAIPNLHLLRMFMMRLKSLMPAQKVAKRKKNVDHLMIDSISDFTVHLEGPGCPMMMRENGTKVLTLVATGYGGRRRRTEWSFLLFAVPLCNDFFPVNVQYRRTRYGTECITLHDLITINIIIILHTGRPRVHWCCETNKEK